MSDLNEILGEEICRTLTEWLGECWHEADWTSRPHIDKCRKCEQRLPFARLDFSDPRVVWRLMEKHGSLDYFRDGDAWAASASCHYFRGATLQEAVCRAVYAKESLGK